jgi:hypothetical protein
MTTSKELIRDQGNEDDLCFIKSETIYILTIQQYLLTKGEKTVLMALWVDWADRAGSAPWR